MVSYEVGVFRACEVSKEMLSVNKVDRHHPGGSSIRLWSKSQIVSQLCVTPMWLPLYKAVQCGFDTILLRFQDSRPSSEEHHVSQPIPYD